MITSTDTIESGIIYKLVDPRNGLPFYVGYTCDPERRYQQHVMGESGSSPKNQRVIELRQLGLTPTMEGIEPITGTVAQISEREIYWIRRYISEGIPLLNVNGVEVRPMKKVSFYITPEQERKLDHLEIDYRQRTGKRINRSHIVRWLIDQYDLLPEDAEFN